MSVFRPINSDESNLYRIRCIVNFKLHQYDFPTSGSAAGVNIAGGTITESSSLETYTNLMETPSTHDLPESFGIHFKYDPTNTTGNKYSFYLNFGKEYVRSPNIHITPLVDLVSDAVSANDRLAASATGTGIVIPQIDVNSNTHYPTESNDNYKVLTDTAITANAYNVHFKFFKTYVNASSVTTLEEADTTDFYGFCVDIVGPVKLGVTTANTNKGWGLAVNEDPGGVYSNLNVGIGINNPSNALTVRGNMEAKFNKCRASSSLLTNKITADTSLNSTIGNAACMYDEIITVEGASGSTITLTPRNALQMVGDLRTLFNFEPQVGMSLDLIVVNLSSTITVTMADPTDVTGPPASNQSTIGNMVVPVSSTGVFKFYFTEVTTGFYSEIYTYQIIRIV